MKEAHDPPFRNRFMIGQALALSWRGFIACRWHLLAIIVPAAALRAVGGSYLYAALPRSLASDWRGMITGWIMAGLIAPAIACLAYAIVRFAEGESLRRADVLRIPWRRLPIVIVATLIVYTVMEGPELLIPKHGTPALVAELLVNIVYKLAVMAFTILLVPILVAERTSFAGALDRSLDLMSGHRWRIVALTLVTWLMLNLASMIHMSWISRWYPAVGGDVFFLVRFVRTFLTLSIVTCIPAAAYCLLRREKQGASPEMVARIFE